MRENLETFSGGCKYRHIPRSVSSSSSSLFLMARAACHRQAADIEAEMKDGLLVLTVRLGTPAIVEAPQVITIH